MFFWHIYINPIPFILIFILYGEYTFLTLDVLLTFSSDLKITDKEQSESTWDNEKKSWREHNSDFTFTEVAS